MADYEVTPAGRLLPPYRDRVLVFSQGRWKPGTYDPAPAGRLKPGVYLDCGTGPIQFTHWCSLPPHPKRKSK